ncbi:MAG TPA: glycerophosphodiester phosphodiesterase [Kofleriaceae bacterium]|nr:glycerophosphodiester phosphodiesterase [Kofleriaceae bacterium]
MDQGGGRRFPLRLYGHRGAAAECPENTLVSFRRALDLGVDALETDVHMTRDGHVVVSHDPNGRRCCGVARELSESRLDEVRQWDAGWGFRGPDRGRPFAGQGVRIPTLEELLVEFRGVRINIDIKQCDPPMVEPLLELVRRHKAEQEVTLASFQLRTLLRVRMAGFAGETALPEAEVATMLFAPALLFSVLPWRGQAAQLPLSSGRLHFDTADMVARCHRLGVRLDFWVVNDPDVAQRLLGLGADGIMTDDPRAVSPVFAPFRSAAG